MIHQVFANRTNVGDWLSARGIRALLGNPPVTEHLCDAPFVPETLERLAHAPSGDLVVIGGGGLLMDYFVPFWEGLLALPNRPRFCVWGAGVCDMKNEATLPPRALLDAIVARSLLTVVRDEHTRQILGGGVLPAPVPCTTFAVVAEQPATKRGVLHVDSFDNVGEAVYEQMDIEARAFAARTGRSFAKTNNILQAGSEAALARLLGLYTAADVVVSSRLHGCIVAIAAGRRVVAVSGDRKVEAFMDAAGLGDWVMDVADIARLREALDGIERQRSPREFVEATHRAHAAVAEQVRRLAP